MKRAVLSSLVVAIGALALGRSTALAAGGIERLHFHAGPYLVTPGANLILLDANKVAKPNQDGYMVRMAPNLRYARAAGKCCGRVPRVDVIHLHHGVWLSTGQAGAGEGNGTGVYPFMASGEEKTTLEFPPGYGYPVAAKDKWILNYMIHNLTDHAARVFITYDIDFIPLARRWRPTSPRGTRSGWMSRPTTSIPSSMSTATAGATASTRSPTWPRTPTAAGRR